MPCGGSFAAAPSRSNRQVGVAFQYALFESGFLAGSPEPRGVPDTVAERATIRRRRPVDRPRDAHEVAFDAVPAGPHTGVAVASQVQELQVRGQIGVRQRTRLRRISALLQLQARADAMTEQHVHGCTGLRITFALGEV